jgi:hypothetical protein
LASSAASLPGSAPGVGEDAQRHLARNPRQRFHQEVDRAHARLDRAEGMLGRLAPLAHRLGVLVEPPLHGFENMLMLPARDPGCLAGVHWRLIVQLGQAFVQ